MSDPEFTTQAGTDISEKLGCFYHKHELTDLKCEMCSHNYCQKCNDWILEHTTAQNPPKKCPKCYLLTQHKVSISTHSTEIISLSICTGFFIVILLLFAMIFSFIFQNITFNNFFSLLVMLIVIISFVGSVALFVFIIVYLIRYIHLKQSQPKDKPLRQLKTFYRTL